MKNINALYAQSGGVTAVINATAVGVIETIKKSQTNFRPIGKLYAGLNGIIGVLEENLIDLSLEPISNINQLRYTPGGAFGSCRYKLKDLQNNSEEYKRLIEVFKVHNIGYFFYNGGGDSQDTAYKLSQIGQMYDYPIICIGIPKTIDNDLAFTDNCPGFGSVAKYIAISTLEASIDLVSMAKSSTKVFILEVMGRNAGWIAASSGIISKDPGKAPHIILFPEIIFDEKKFCATVKNCVEKFGHCVIVASEGIRGKDNKPINFSSLEHSHTDQFGHIQLGGVAATLANLINKNLKFKTHWAVADYLQRSARHIASKVDVEQAYALGEAAVEMALSGMNAVMPIIVRTSNQPYTWEIKTANLSEVANIEKKLPYDFITDDGFNITNKCREYILPLIQGEDYPLYSNGLPQYVSLEKHMVAKKLPQFKI
jgi:ATP-dependent phosphofructokinase / diphosphate-dependent phosphofructokinase